MMQVTREATQLENGSWLVTVTPPAWSGFKGGSTITLTPGEYERYLRWLVTRENIQAVFPTFTADQREILMTGIGGDEWDEKIPDEDEVLAQAERMSQPITDEHLDQVCKIGQGADCCRYLTMGAKGWSCEKHSVFKLQLDERVARNDIVAQGDNCEGRLSR